MLLNKSRYWSLLFWMLLAVAIMALWDVSLAQYNSWSYNHYWKMQSIVKTGLSFQLPWDIGSRKPLAMMSPVANEVVKEAVATDGMTPVEKKILDKFGVLNYQVAHAVAKCESGLRVDAVNWETHDLGLFQINWPVWEKPVKEKFGYSLVDMFDVDKNIEVAHWIWDRDNSGHGSWNPWVASRSDCFAGQL